MPHFCLFAGSEAIMDPGGSVAITLFGGMTLKKPPLAHVLVEQTMRRSAPARRTFGADDHDPQPFIRINSGAWSGNFVFTVFGGTEVRWPTLAEEFLALKEAVSGGLLTLADWDRALGRGGAHITRIGSFTVCAGLEAYKLPPEDKEIDDLALQRHLGHIPPRVMDMLILGVGQLGVPRFATVRRAVAESLNGPGNDDSR